MPANRKAVPLAKVHSIAKARRKRDPAIEAFAPMGLDDVVGTVGPAVGERDTHVAVKGPPQGSMWAFSPEQAREVAKMLVGFADWVEGAQDEVDTAGATCGPADVDANGAGVAS